MQKEITAHLSKKYCEINVLFWIRIQRTVLVDIDSQDYGLLKTEWICEDVDFEEYVCHTHFGLIGSHTYLYIKLLIFLAAICTSYLGNLCY